MLNRKEQGVTLISLVVTIVILIILAAVSITMIIGNNGIITQADRAKTETRAGECREAVETWKGELFLEGYNATGSVKTEGEMLDSLLEKKLAYAEEIDENNKSITIGNEIISYDTGEIVNAKTISENPKIYYGKYVENYTCSDERFKDCRIFYADNNNIYLMVNNLPTGKEYHIDLAKYTGGSDITSEHPAYKWISSFLNIHPATEYESMKMVAAMFDESIWNGFKGENADYVIASPTLDMYAASFNQTHTNQIKYSVDENNDIGYIIENGGEREKKENFNSIYWDINCIHIASPCSTTQTETLIQWQGYLTDNWAWNLTMRPIICLKEGTQLRYNEETDTYRIL